MKLSAGIEGAQQHALETSTPEEDEQVELKNLPPEEKVFWGVLSYCGQTWQVEFRRPRQPNAMVCARSRIPHRKDLRRGHRPGPAQERETIHTLKIVKHNSH